MTRASLVHGVTIAAVAAVAAVVLAASGACAPDLGNKDSLVTRVRVLAIKGEPAEAAPGDDVAYSVLVASPDGTVTGAAIAWATCAAPKPLGENDVVPAACLDDGHGDDVRPLGVGTSASAFGASLPADACALYGPETPSGDFRPRDPDVTGGYYQPVRASLASDAAIHLQRVACKLANAPADVATEFAKRYVKNANPHLDVAFPARVASGQRVELTASFGADGAESYVVFDPASQSVAVRRESLRVSWFSSAGTFDADRTGRTAEESATSSTNGWVAPKASGPDALVVHLWVVVRDSRGGIDFVAKDLAVVPE
jgi:hypothetical protein